MAKVQHFSGISKRIPFEGIDFYDLFRVTFKNSERGRKSFFSPEGKVALMFLKMYTQLSAPKLMEQLNGNVHYQIFCDVYVNPLCPLTNYKLIDDIISELSDNLKILQLQNILADAWKPYMKSLIHSTQMRHAMRARCAIQTGS